MKLATTSHATIRAGLGTVALASGLGLLTSCGGSSEAPPPTPGPSGPTFVVVGSASQTRAVQATSFAERLLAWLGPRAAHAQATTAGSPTSLKVRLYALYLSPNADCSGPILVQDYGSTPVERDVFTSPTLFEGSPPDGSYPCVIFKTSDNLRITPDAAAETAWPGRCVAGVESTTDTYRTPDSDFRDPSGAVIPARGTRAAPVADIVYNYSTTDVVAATGRAGGPSANQTGRLATAMVVPGRTTLYFDATDGMRGDVEMGTPYCVVERGAMGFR